MIMLDIFLGLLSFWLLLLILSFLSGWYCFYKYFIKDEDL